MNKKKKNQKSLKPQSKKWRSKDIGYLPYAEWTLDEIIPIR
ncbi:MAG TPA: hypothetical protein VF181_08170 [Balneolaceae bacterium]